MIVRVMSEGQYSLDDALCPSLSDMDRRLADRIRAGDEGGFASTLADTICFVRLAGQRLDDSEIVRSGAIVPYPGMTLAEAQALLSGPIAN